MSLTNDDLKQIGSIVTKAIEPLRTDVAGLKTDVAGLRVDVTKLQRGQARLTTEVRYLRKSINIVIDTFDRRDIALNKRVVRIEQHLGFAN